MQTGIDTVLVVLGSLVFLCQPLFHTALFIRQDQAAVIGVGIGMGEQCHQATVGFMEIHHPVKVHVEYRIGIQQEEVFFQVQLKESPGIAQGGILHEIFNMYAPLAAIPEVLLDFLVEVGDS